MSSRKTDKSKKSSKDSKNQDVQATVVQNEPVPEVVLEKPKDIRTILITVNSFRNILPLYPISDARVSLKYLDQDVGESKIIPVTDDEKLELGDTFEIAIDVNSSRQIDLIASNPIFVTTIQSSGSLDMALYEQLKKSQVEAKPPEEVESLFSMYEAFTGERPSTQLLDVKKKKKGKKEKMEKASKEKPQGRSRSVISKESKKSKKSSKTSAASSKTGSKTRTEAPVIKSEVYGMCVIDLIPLFYGEISFSETLLIQPIKRTSQILSTFKNFPELAITVSLKENMKLVDIANILNFTVESICNIPSLMYTDMSCTVCCMLPLQNQSAYPTQFHNPKITSRAPNKQVPKRWPGIHDIGYNANTTKYLIDSNFKEVTNKANLNLEEGFKEDAPRLEFNYLKRNIMFRNSYSDFSAHLLSYKKLVLEIYLTPRTKKRDKAYDAISDDADDIPHTKPKGSKIPPYLHLMAVLDVVALLYPGFSKIHIAAPVTTFSHEEAAKCGLEDSFYMPKPQLDIGTARTSKTKLDTTRKKKPEKKEKPSKKDKGSSVKEDKNLASQLPPKPEDLPPPEPVTQVYNEEGKPCFVIVEIELLKPLKPKRDTEELKSDLHRLQLQALQTSKTILNKHVADDFYLQTVREIVDDINEKWIQYSELTKTIPPPSYADFLEYLQKTGVYLSYLNSITLSATLLVTNKYKCEERDFKNSKTYQNLVSEVFIDLISQMHSVLNSLMCNGMKAIEEKYTTPWDVSFFYAKEAAELKLYSTANRYFLERIINDQDGNPNLWFDYSIYQIEINNTDEAFECIRESIAICCTDKYSLLLFGALMADKENFHDAETCLLNILILESKWVEGWCVLYLFYQKFGKPEGMQMALDMGRKLYDDATLCDYFFDFEDLAWSWKNIPNTIFFKTAVLLLKMRLYSWAELALAEEVLVPKHYGYVNYLLAVASYYKKDFDHALEHIREAKESLGADFAILGLSGHILLGKGLLEEARDEYFRVIESFDRPEDIHIIYMNCADILVKLGDYQKARKFILTTCKIHQTPHVWFSAGILYFKQNDLLSAEECLTEANMIDNRHAEIWGYLTLVNLRLTRMHEAEQCYQQAVKSKLENEVLDKLIIEEFSKARSLY